MNRRLLAYKKQTGNNFWEDLNAVWTLRKVSFWSNAVVKIRRDSDNATAFVFVDGATSQDEISTSSYISTSSNTTPSATTLSSWVSADDAFVEQWIGCTTDDVIDSDFTIDQTNTGRQPQIISSGAIITKGGKPTIDFLSSTRTLWKSLGMKNGGYLDEFTILTVSSVNITNTVGWIIKFYHPSSDYIGILNDSRSAVKRNLILNTVGGSYHNDNLAFDTSTDLKLLSTIKSTTFTRTYKDGSFQQEVSQDGLAYDNSRYVFGGFSDSNSYNMKISEIIMFKDVDQTKISERQTNINDFYSIY